jgi:hypothetical protein
MGQQLFIDNHNVPPTDLTLDILSVILSLAANVERITYEAELAGTDVQIMGLKKLGRA